MKVIIDKNLNCKLFRSILENCSEDEKRSICSSLNEEGPRNKSVLHMLMFIFHTCKDDIYNEDDRKNGIISDRDTRNRHEIDAAPNGNGTVWEGSDNPRQAGNADVSKLAKDLGTKMDGPGRTWEIGLQNDDQNSAASVILGIPFDERHENAIFNHPWNDENRLYMHRDSLIDIMIALDDHDTIQVRLNKFHENLKIQIAKYCRQLDDAQKEALKNRFGEACEEEIGDTDVSAWLIDRCMDNLKRYSAKLLGILNNELPNPDIFYKTYQGIQYKIENLIESGITQIVLTGAPGTGKTHMATKIAELMGTPLSWESDKDKNDKEKKYEFVQFHPSYDYTDFVEGLRPVQDGEDITFKKMDGVFMRFCRWVAYQNFLKNNEGKENEEKYFFIIDEINRADLSKVFGELMYGLEADKRGRDIKTQYQNLETYFEDRIKEYFNDETGNGSNIPDDFKKVFQRGFFIPKNVIVIGTMNDIDRSVESMDYALRRRFIWQEVEVTNEYLKSAFEVMLPKKVKDKSKDLAERVMTLNKVFIDDKYKEFGLNKHYFISQGQFSGLLNTKKWEIELDEDNDMEEVWKAFIEEAWDRNVKLLLEEYVRGEDEEKANDFLEACETALTSDPLEEEGEP